MVPPHLRTGLSEQVGPVAIASRKAQDHRPSGKVWRLSTFLEEKFSCSTSLNFCHLLLIVNFRHYVIQFT